MSFLIYPLLLAQNLGLGKTYPWALLPLDLGRWIWLLATMPVLVLIAEQARFVRLSPMWGRRSARIEAALGQRWALASLLAGNALFAVVSFNHFARFGYGLPWLHWVILGAAVAFVRRDRFWLSCAISLALLAASVIHFPLAADRSDMLPGIQAGWDRLAVGHSPYAWESPIERTSLPMPYFPWTFFSHGPAWVLGIDLRWNQWVWRLLWMLGLGLALGRFKAASPWRVAAHWFVLNPYFNFRHELYYEVFFAGIVAYHAWPRWRWLSLPALVWIRQWAWVMAPFLALDWLLRGQAARKKGSSPPLNWRKLGVQAAWLAMGALLASGATALALSSTTTLDRFVQAIFPEEAEFHFDYGLGLGAFAEALGADFVLQPLQAVVAGAAGILTLGRWWWGRFGAELTEGIERMGLLTLCVLILLHPSHAVSVWLEATFWILAAYVLREPGRG